MPTKAHLITEGVITGHKEGGGRTYNYTGIKIDIGPDPLNPLFLLVIEGDDDICGVFLQTMRDELGPPLENMALIDPGPWIKGEGVKYYFWSMANARTPGQN